MNRIASVLILVLAVVMLNRGLLAFNINVGQMLSPHKDYSSYTASVIEEDCQRVEVDLAYNSYGDIIVQKDIPVKLVINAEEQYLTGCNEEVVLRSFDIRRKLISGENIIEFTPTEEGEYTYSCWMNMIVNRIKVIDDENYFAKE